MEDCIIKSLISSLAACCLKQFNILHTLMTGYKFRLGRVGLSWVGLGWVGLGSRLFQLAVGRVGLGLSIDGLGWVGSQKMDPWTTLQRHIAHTSVGTAVSENSCLKLYSE